MINLARQSFIAANTKISKATALKPLLPNDKLTFGSSFTDHMLSIDWNAKSGWEDPVILPYQNLSLDPASTVFHYGVECFEGMKAYKDKQGKIRLFRPDMNMARFLKSCKRLTLPEFDENQMLECIKKFVMLEERFIPSQQGYSLYLRPTAIATQASLGKFHCLISILGVGPSSRAKIFMIASPVGPYYKTGFSAVSLYATTKFVRAWPGGTGDSKIGPNYAPGILPQVEVAKEGFAQVLWLFGKDNNVTEVGTMVISNL